MFGLGVLRVERVPKSQNDKGRPSRYIHFQQDHGSTNRDNRSRAPIARTLSRNSICRKMRANIHNTIFTSKDRTCSALRLDVPVIRISLF